MLKKYKYLLIAAGAFLAYRVYAKLDTAQNLVLSVSKIGFAITGQGVVLTLFVTARNIKRENILLNSLRGDLKYNGTNVGAFTNDLQIDILPEQTTTFPINVLLFYSGISDVIISILNGQVKQRAIFTLDGTAVVENITVPFKIDYPFP